MRKVILLGPPGAGKGTQAVLLASKLNVPHISTGEIMRAAISEQTDLGKQAKNYMDAGNLVPDEIVVNLVAERLSQEDCANGYILDGFPRTLIQAQEFSKRLKECCGNKQSSPKSEDFACNVVELVVPEDILLSRIKQRSLSGSGRSDDSLEVAANRLEVFWKQTAPVCKFYEDQGQILKVDGLGTVAEVQEKIFKVLKLN